MNNDGSKAQELQKLLLRIHKLEPGLAAVHRDYMQEAIRGDDGDSEASKLPSWAFWTYEMTKTSIKVLVSASKYVDFLAARGFRIFMKRGQPTVVVETEIGMEKTVVRGRTNTTVKEFVIDHLEKHYFFNVVDYLLINSKFFSIDVLETLPEIHREKARASIFSEHDTHISLKTPLEKEEPLISFNDSPVLIAGNTLAIVGKQGLGKSGVCELFASLAVDPHCEPLSPFTFNLQGGLTVWVDTERTSNDMVYACKRIKERTQAWKQEKTILNDAQSDFRKLRIERCAAIDDKMTWVLELLDTIEEPIDLLILDGALDTGGNTLGHARSVAEKTGFTYNPRPVYGSAGSVMRNGQM